jgi:hypothetical protein
MTYVALNECDIDPTATYFTVTRMGMDIAPRAIPGLDLLMFPCSTPVFTCPEATDQFCKLFNTVQETHGIVSLSAGATLLLDWFKLDAARY